MSAIGGGTTSTGTPPLPRSIWVVAVASLADQVVRLLVEGVRPVNEVSLVGSVLLGALLVGWVSAGVVRARTVRLVLAWVVLVLAGVFGVVGLFLADGATDLLVTVFSVATTLAALAGLWAFRGTEWYAWQRTRPATHEGASITGLVAVAAVVGALGGLIGPAGDGPRFDAEISVTGDRP